MECNSIVKEYIEDLYKKKKVLGIKPLGVSQKLNIDIKEVLKTCVILEKRDLLKQQLLFSCDCGCSKIGTVDILGEKCDWCDNIIDEFNTYVEYKFIRK